MNDNKLTQNEEVSSILENISEFLNEKELSEKQAEALEKALNMPPTKIITRNLKKRFE